MDLRVPKNGRYYWTILSILIDLDLLSSSSLVAIKFELGIFQKFKMDAGSNIGNMKYLRIRNDTILIGFRVKESDKNVCLVIRGQI